MTDLRLPPERFFFALLDTSSLPPAGATRRRRQLDALLEVVLPIPVEQVQARYVPVGRNHIVACGVARDRLHELTTAHPDALTLGPAELPLWLREQLEERDLAAPAADELNLLVDDFEPTSVRRARRRGLLHAAAAICLLTLILAIGLHRRTLAVERQAARIDAQVEEVYARFLPDLPGGRSRHAAITSELRRLRQTRRPEQRDILSVDPTPTLASLLETWPDNVQAQTQTVSANESLITVATSLASHADAERLIDALAPPDGLRAIQPTVRTDRDRVHLDLRFEREAQR